MRVCLLVLPFLESPATLQRKQRDKASVGNKGRGRDRKGEGNGSGEAEGRGEGRTPGVTSHGRGGRRGKGKEGGNEVAGTGEGKGEEDTCRRPICAHYSVQGRCEWIRILHWHWARPWALANIEFGVSLHAQGEHAAQSRTVLVLDHASVYTSQTGTFAHVPGHCEIGTAYQLAAVD